MVFIVGAPASPVLFGECKAVGSNFVARDYTDRRRHERIEVVKAIFIEVVSRRSRRESDNTIIRCETIDVSLSGLRIFVTQLIAQGSQLNIAVPMDDWKENLELVGEAVWVKPVEKGEGYWVGLELRDSNRENMAKWFKVVHSLSSTPPG
jgi:PilZ domain